MTNHFPKQYWKLAHFGNKNTKMTSLVETKEIQLKKIHSKCGLTNGSISNGVREPYFMVLVWKNFLF